MNRTINDTLLIAACGRLLHLTQTYPQAGGIIERAFQMSQVSSGLINLCASADDEVSSLNAQLARRKKAWTVRELADLLSLSDRSLYDQINSGALPAARIATIFRICPADALEWYRARITNPTPRR